MERLLRMSEEQFVESMLPEVRRVLRAVAAAVNDAPDGRVIDGSEMRVRDLMGDLRTRVFEAALQMRVDDTEGAFSPSPGRGGPGQAEQGPVPADRADGQRAGGTVPHPVARPRRGGRHAGRPAAGRGRGGGQPGGA